MPLDNIFLAILAPILPTPIIPNSFIYSLDFIKSTITCGLYLISIKVQ